MKLTGFASGATQIRRSLLKGTLSHIFFIFELHAFFTFMKNNLQGGMGRIIFDFIYVFLLLKSNFPCTYFKNSKLVFF